MWKLNLWGIGIAFFLIASSTAKAKLITHVKHSKKWLALIIGAQIALCMLFFCNPPETLKESSFITNFSITFFLCLGCIAFIWPHSHKASQL